MTAYATARIIVIVIVVGVRNRCDMAAHATAFIHLQVVQVAWDPKVISFADILRQFWQSHDPTQGMGQGHDRGTQYRSGMSMCKINPNPKP